MRSMFELSIDKGVARFTINRPEKRNAMTLAMWHEMGEIFGDWTNDPKIRVIIVTGAGEKCFCAGNDISEFSELRSTPEQVSKYNAVVSNTYKLVKNISKPTIARIAGSCVGGGLEIAQLCDLQIAADTASFGVTPTKLGIAYKFEDSLLLVNNIGIKAAKEMLFTAQIFPASDALRWGLVNRVVSEVDLDKTVEQLAADIAFNAPLSVKATKLILNETQKITIEPDLNFCQVLLDTCTNSEDVVEGRQAFLEKRAPKFKGK